MSERRVVLVVEDDNDLTRLIKLRFNAQSDFEVLGEARTAEDAVVLAEAITPDLVVLDHRLASELTGMNASAQLKDAAPGCRILLFSASEELREEAMRNPHVDGFVLKTDVGRLVDRAREVLAAASG